MRIQRPGSIALATFVIVVGAGLCAVILDGPPSPRPAGIPPTEFSAERAMRHVEQVAQRPHPVGSADHARVRDYVVAEIERLGLKAERQDATGMQKSARVVAGAVENVLVRLAGTESRSAVLLATHYDSAPVSPGASDDGAGVAVLLETLRALKAGAPLRNDLVALVSDAEEEGLLGAAAFVAEHPWAKDIRVAVNFEARGTRGASLMFETGPDNGLMVSTWANSVPHPAGSSLSYEVYKRLPNDSDFTIFRRAGIGGLNFAFIGNVEAYHTPFDSVANLDSGSLQQHGEAALALARRFGDADLSVTRGPDAVYFSVPVANLVVHYSATWAFPLSGLGLVVWILALRQAYRRKQTSLGGLVLGWVIVMAIGAAAVFAGLRAGRALAWLHTNYLEPGNVQGSPAYAISLAMAVLAVWLALYVLLRKKFAAQTLALAASLVGLIGAIVSARQLAGGSYVFLWPLFGALVSILWMPADTTGRTGDTGRAFILWLFGLPTVFIVLPLCTLLFSAVGLSVEGGAALAAGTVLGAWMLTPQVELVSEGRRYWPAALAVLVAIGALALGAATTRYSASQPRNETLLYFLDTDAGSAFWSARADRPDEWLGQYLGLSPRAGRPAGMVAPWLSASAPAGFLHAPAPVLQLGAPRAELVESTQVPDGRALTLRLTPGVAGHLLTLWLSGVEISGAELEGRNAKGAGAIPQPSWGLSYANAPQSGIVLKLQVKGTAPVTLALIDWSSGLPQVPGSSFAPRPPALMQAFRGDQSLVRKSYVF
jgi:hypothetical protein